MNGSWWQDPIYQWVSWYPTLHIGLWPNSAQVSFLEGALKQLHLCRGSADPGGDWNVAIRFLVRYDEQCISFLLRSIKVAEKCLFSHQLTGIWWVVSPTDRDYTHDLAPHNTYSRIDMFLILHYSLSKVKNVAVGSIHISDHAPISLDVELVGSARTPFQLRLKESLLQDSVVMADVVKEQTQFFSLNLMSDSTPMTIWETHKPFIRGLFIKHGSDLKS